MLGKNTTALAGVIKKLTQSSLICADNLKRPLVNADEECAHG